MPQIDLPISSYDDPPSSTARLVNCYIEKGGPQGIGPVLRGFPGISAYRSQGDEIRAALVVHGVKYFVTDDKLYRITGGGQPALIGTLAFGSSRPQMASNGIQLCVVIEPDAWVYTIATDTLAQITDTDFTTRGASSVQFIDNFLSFTEPDSGRWFISDLAAAEDYDALNFATAEGAPDHLVTHVVDHGQAILLGVESGEIWDNAGLSGFPFVRSGNGLIEIGCLAKWSAAKVDQSVIWLASDYTVRRLQGVTPVRISTEAVERSIRGYTAASAYALTFTWDGHIYYVLTFPEATLAFDVTSGQWFELQSYGLDNWRVSCAVQADGRTYVGDSQSGKFGLLDDVFQEWDDPLVMTWTYAPTREKHNCIEIMAEMGVGLASGQGSDPEIMLAKSDDGGQSFTELPTRSLGVIGNRQARAKWHRLGSIRKSNLRVYRASISDPVERHVFATVLS